jgi:hypothetical protein
MSDGSEFFECSCYSDEHTLRIMLDDDPDYPELYTSVFLNNYNTGFLGFFKRVWIAIKYVFGYKSKYGHWDCFNLRRGDADRLIATVEKFKELCEKSKFRNNGD